MFTKEEINDIMLRACLIDLPDDYGEFLESVWGNYKEAFMTRNPPDRGEVGWAFSYGYLRGIAYHMHVVRQVVKELREWYSFDVPALGLETEKPERLLDMLERINGRAD